MKKATKLFFGAIITLMIFMSPLTLADDTVTYEENFETDTPGANPDGNFYNYSAENLTWMNVSDDTGFLSSQSYLHNSTGAYGGATFDFIDDTYDYFEVNFKINDASHNFTMLSIGTWYEPLSIHGAFCYFNITNSYCDFNVLTDTSTFTQIWNQSIENNTWYRLRVEFDYDSHDITGELWEEIYGVGGVPHKLKEETQTCTISYINITQSSIGINAAHGNDSCFIYIDDIILGETSTDESSSTIDSVGIPIYIIAMGCVILVLFLIMFMFETGQLDSTFFIYLLLCFVLIIITVSTLFSL